MLGHHGGHLRNSLFGLILVALFAPSALSQTWTARRVLSAGEAQGISFGGVRDLAVSSDGAFYVLDGTESRVHHLSADGQLVRTFGRRGGGPGEVSAHTRQLLLVADRIVVVDLGNQRLSVFGADGAFIGSRTLGLDQAMAAGWGSSGSRAIALVPPMPRGFGFDESASGHKLLALDPLAPAAADTLMRLTLPPENDIVPGAQSVTVDLSVPKLHVASGAEGRVLVAASDTFRIRVLERFGKEIASLTRAVKRVRYSAAEQERLRAEADSNFRRAYRMGAGASGSTPPEIRVTFRLPQYAPLVDGLVGGDRFVLVGRSTRGASLASVWDLLAYDGRYLGSVTFPAGFRAVAALGNRVWGVERDADDVESVAVYELVLGR